jgi:hypothetical protein
VRFTVQAVYIQYHRSGKKHNMQKWITKIDAFKQLFYIELFSDFMMRDISAKHLDDRPC